MAHVVEAPVVAGVRAVAGLVAGVVRRRVDVKVSNHRRFGADFYVRDVRCLRGRMVRACEGMDTQGRAMQGAIAEMPEVEPQQ